MDAPRNNEIVGREVDVSGWAVDDAGVAEVRIFVDGKQAASTGLTLPRPDVSKVHPTYATRGDVHGWQATVDLGEAETTHSIQVRVVDNQGATRDIGSVVVKVIGRN